MVLLEHQQIIVTGNDQVRPCGQRTGEYRVVIWITRYPLAQRAGFDGVSQRYKAIKKLAGAGLRLGNWLFKLVAKNHILQLSQQLGRGEKRVLGVFKFQEQLCWEPSINKGGGNSQCAVFGCAGGMQCKAL